MAQMISMAGVVNGITLEHDLHEAVTAVDGFVHSARALAGKYGEEEIEQLADVIHTALHEMVPAPLRRAGVSSAPEGFAPAPRGASRATRGAMGRPGVVVESW